MKSKKETTSQKEKNKSPTKIINKTNQESPVTLSPENYIPQKNISEPLGT